MHWQAFDQVSTLETMFTTEWHADMQCQTALVVSMVTWKKAEETGGWGGRGERARSALAAAQGGAEAGEAVDHLVGHPAVQKGGGLV